MHQHTSNRRRRLSVGTGTAALSLGLCLCAGQLISTPAANAATPVGTAALASAKVQPHLGTSVSTHYLRWGSSVAVTAKLINPKTGQAITTGSVRLQYWNKSHWVNYKTVAVRGGTAKAWAHPKTSTYLRYQYLGNSRYTTKTGITVLVRVRADGAQVLAEARSHTGALYKFAAAGPKRFDCSGFTEYVYKKTAGKSLPHKANSQQHYGSAVSKGSKKVGDLIIFRSGSYGYHAAIYAGNGYMYDSPHTGARVGKHKIYGGNYVVRRLVAA